MITSANRQAGTDYSRYQTVNEIDAETIKKARDIFDDFSRQGVIINGACFEDNVWPVTNEIKKTKINFKFSDIEYEKHARRWIGCTSECFRNAAKCYVLFQMGSRILSRLRLMARTLCSVAGLDTPEEGEFGWKALYLAELLHLIPGFSEIRNAAIEYLEDSIELYPVHHGKQRKLLDFRSYFQFHDALEEYWKRAEEEDRAYYFPLYLWWKLTAILPLRVTEFLIIPRNCLQKADEGYLITVRRTKLKGGNTLIGYRVESDYEKKVYPVSEDIAEEILRYKEAMKDMKPSDIDSLFCCEPYRKRHLLSRYTIYSYECLKNTKNEFYRDILDGKGIPNVQLGDTRHIAMMNLIISGGSPRMCMELAGHVNVGISSHYYSNMASLVSCATLEMYRKSKNGTAAVINGSSVYSLTPVEELTQIPGGWCSSPKRRLKQVDDCVTAVNTLGEIGDCRCCRHFRRERQGRHLDFYDTEQAREKVEADSVFLRDMVDAVRQGIGCQENITAAMLRLAHSSQHYRECLWNQFRENDNGQTKESGER